MNELLERLLEILILSLVISGTTTFFLHYFLDDNFFWDEPNGDLENFVKVARKWADTHEYINDTYTCVNFSNDVYDLAEAMDMEVEIIKGCPVDDDKDCHQWLKISVDFEPQYGAWVDFSEEYPLRRMVVK